MKTLRPVNQKTVYCCFAEVYGKMHDKIAESLLKGIDPTVEEIEALNHALTGMNKVQLLELKRKELTGEPLRIIETKNFDQIPLGENKPQTE